MLRSEVGAPGCGQGPGWHNRTQPRSSSRICARYIRERGHSPRPKYQPALPRSDPGGEAYLGAEFQGREVATPGPGLGTFPGGGSQHLTGPLAMSRASSLLNAEHPLLWTTIHQCDTMPRTATAQRVKQISSDSDSLRAILSLQNLCLKKAPKPDK